MGGLVREARARIIKAMAHGTRLFIVEELSRQERCVYELTDMIGVDVSTVSKHLSVLKNAGLVIDHKERSNKVYYQLKVPTIQNFSLWAMQIIRENIPRPGFHAARQTVAGRKDVKEEG